MVMIELQAAQEKPPAPARPHPPATFSSPFSTPTLQWARRKRLRCSNALLDPSRRLSSPSPDASPARDWKKPPIRPRTPRKDEGFEEGERPQKVAEPEEEPKPTDEGGWFLRSRAVGGFGSCGVRKKKRVELWISLSREEIEEDYYSITGLKLPRRPKKRPRNSPANLPHRIFPGSWLPNIVTSEMYKVHEPSEARKR